MQLLSLERMVQSLLSPFLRYGIMDYGKGKEEQRDAEPSTEDLFRYLDSQIPWLVSEEGLQYERCVFALMSFGSLCNDATLSMGSAWSDKQIAISVII